MTDKNTIQNCFLFANDRSKRRPSQIELSDTATKAALAKKNALIQGATGIGKTRALLSSTTEYLLDNSNNKAIYAVRTIGQMLQVEEEFNESEILSFLEIGVVRLGVSFGITPMIEKICTTGPKKEMRSPGFCNNCILYNQRFLHSVLVGSCLSSDYTNARNIGVCPYSYMRTNLPKSNLIITTMGSLNQKQWILRNIGGREEQDKTIVVVDEAHSYLSDLTNVPVATVTMSPSGNKVHSFSQQESDLTLGEQFGNFTSRAGNLVSWFEMKDRVREECGVVTNNLNELKMTLESHLKTKDQNEQDLKKLKDQTLEIIKMVRKGERPPIDVYAILDRVLDAKQDRLVSTIETCLSLHDELNRLESIQNQAREIKQHILEESKKLQRGFSELRNDYFEVRQLFFDAKDKFLLTSNKRNSAYESKKRCHDTKNYTNFEKIKNDIENLKSECDFLWRQKEEYKELFLEKKKLYQEQKSLVEDAKGKYFKAKEYWDNVCRLQKAAYESKRKAYKKLDEICKNVFDSSKEAFLAGKRLKSLSQDFNSVKRNFRLGVEGGSDRDDKGYVGKTIARCLALQKALYLIEDDLREILMQKHAELSFSDIPIASKKAEIYDAIQGIKMLQDDFGAPNTWWAIDALQILETIYDAYMNPEQFWVTIEEQEERKNICLFDLDIGEKVSRFIGGFSSILLISGTLEPLEKTARLLGWNDAVVRAFESPFDENNYLSYVVTGVHSGVLKSGERINLRQMDLIRNYFPQIINIIKGNIGIFVASESLLYQIYDRLKDDDMWPEDCKHLVLSQKYPNLDDDYKILAEKTGISNIKSIGANAEWSEILKSNFNFPICVWMASAGKYGEGIDFPGKMLEACMLLGIPFPSMEHQKNILKAQENYYKKFKGDAEKSIVSELTRVVFPYRKLAQAAGRVHRRVSDIGAIFFWDERLLGVKHDVLNGKEFFKRHLPRDNAKSRLEILPKHILNTLKIADLTYGATKKEQVRDVAESLGFSQPLNGTEFIHDLEKSWKQSN